MKISEKRESHVRENTGGARKRTWRRKNEKEIQRREKYTKQSGAESEKSKPFLWV